MNDYTAIWGGRHIFNSAIFLVALTLFLPRSIRADEASQPTAFYEQLISDALPIHQKDVDLAAIDSAPDGVAALRDREPIETSDWQNLQIGEFESQEDFTKRQDQAHAKESDRYMAAMASWQKDLAAAEARKTEEQAKRDVIANRNVTPKLLAHMPDKPLGRIFAFSTSPSLTLPTFDRSAMAFSDVQLSIGTDEKTFRGDDAILGQFAWGTVKLQIVIQDLEVARQFKDDAANGKITFGVAVEPWLTDIESPIVVKPAYMEKAVDKAEVAGAVVGAVIAGLSGSSDAENMASTENSQRQYEKDVTHPAETRPGVRFRFELRPRCIAVIDQQGDVDKRITIAPLGSGQTNVRVMNMNEPPLQSGDEILAVAGQKISTVRQCVGLIQTLPADRQFDVVYRSSEDGHKHQFRASHPHP